MMQGQDNLLVGHSQRMIRFFACLLIVQCSFLYETTPLTHASAPDSSELPFTTDRPGVGDTAYLVPAGYWQLEGGVTYQHDRTQDPLERNTSVSAPNTVIRLGVLDILELRLLGGEYVYQKTSSGNNDEHDHGASAPVIGTKVQLIKEGASIPQMALFLNLTLPFGSERLRPDDVTPDFKVAANYAPSDRVSWEGNLGVGWEDGLDNITGIYTTALGVSLTNKFTPFVEVFGNLNGPSTHGFDAGFTYLIFPTLQADLSGGPALTDAATDWFVAAGISYRFPHL